MQKARRHPKAPTACKRTVSGSISLPYSVLFTFPSRYWFTIGLSGVFSLTGWSRQIQTGFHVSRPTQDTARYTNHFVYGAITLYGQLSNLFHFLFYSPHRAVLQPQNCRNKNWFGLFPVRSPLLRESLLFSLPPGT
jgi:hypothetical protein